MRRSSASTEDPVDSCGTVVQPSTFLHRTPDTLSLHFDFSATQSEMRLDAPEDLVLGYTRTMMGFLLFQPNPAKIAMIGLGGGSLAKYCYAKLPDASIAVAEISSQVIAWRDEFCVPKDDGRFRVVCQDGADFVLRPGRRCDVLLVDGYGPAGPAPELCTERFYDACYRRLTPGGVMAVNLAFFRGTSHRESISRIRRSFANQVVVVESEDPGNRIAFACKGGMRLPELRSTGRARDLELRYAVDLPRTLRCIRDELEGRELAGEPGV